MTPVDGHLQQASIDAQVTNRRAIEALRAGVPSRAGVRALGLGQPQIEDAFTSLLETVGPAAARPSRREDRRRGLLIGGGFGSGKSHTLEHLSVMAAERGFVVSRVVVSKETPLHDPNAGELGASGTGSGLGDDLQGSIHGAGSAALAPAEVVVLVLGGFDLSGLAA